MPLAGNPVIDNGAGLGCPTVDQRGVARPSGLACDAGAVEYVAGAPALATAFEYFNNGFGHYFVTVLTDEIAKPDAGAFVGWTRTGQQFNVYRKTAGNLGLYNNGQGGAPNHRFTVDPVIRAQMVASGYVGEGAGIGVGMCSPQ